jgi:hypothetical protein
VAIHSLGKFSYRPKTVLQNLYTLRLHLQTVDPGYMYRFAKSNKCSDKEPFLGSIYLSSRIAFTFICMEPKFYILHLPTLFDRADNNFTAAATHIIQMSPPQT